MGSAFLTSRYSLAPHGAEKNKVDGDRNKIVTVALLSPQSEGWLDAGNTAR